MRVENYKLFSDLYNDYSPCSLIQILSTTRKLIDKRILYFISLTIEQDEYKIYDLIRKFESLEIKRQRLGFSQVFANFY